MTHVRRRAPPSMCESGFMGVGEMEVGDFAGTQRSGVTEQEDARSRIPIRYRASMLVTI